MKYYICLYSLTYLDCDDNPKEANGLIYADNFTDAVTQLERDIYGDDIIKINEIELYESLALFSKETFETIKKELNSI